MQQYGSDASDVTETTNSVGFGRGKNVLKEDGMFIKNVQRFAELFAVVTRLVKGISLETLLTFKVEMSLIC
jgi:hypothetical protein